MPARFVYPAVLHNCKYRRLRAPATSFIWTKRSPASGDLLLSLAAFSIPRQVALQRDCQLVALRLEQDRLGQQTEGFHLLVTTEAIQRATRGGNEGLLRRAPLRGTTLTQLLAPHGRCVSHDAQTRVSVSSGSGTDAALARRLGAGRRAAPT